MLDSTDLAVTSQEARSPAVAFDGRDWLVVWQQSYFGSGHQIYAARVSAAGLVLDAKPFVVSGADNSDEVQPAVACDGTDCLVV